jgi:dUTP pyrophosphatase
MTDFEDRLLQTFGKYMHLQLYIDSDDVELKETYVQAIQEHHNKFIYNDYELADAGFDIFAPTEQTMTNSKVNKLDCKIICRASIVDKDMGERYTGFYMYPRSSISKSNLRLANNVGIIDAGYRGHLIGMFDVVYTDEIVVNKFDRYLQICAPGLMPICVQLVESKELLGIDTVRGDGGFGSTGR